MRASGSPSSPELPESIEYTDEQERQIAAQLLAVQVEIQGGGHRDAPIAPRYVVDLHRRVFQGTGIAGEVRRPGWGQEHKIFGPNRSAHRADVEPLLAETLDKARVSVASVLDNPEDEDRDQSALHIAVWAHAEFIRIHPFEDGNGRTSRLLLDSLLVMMGLQPIALETVKEEYFDCLNNYFDGNGIQALLDLFIRLAADQLS